VKLSSAGFHVNTELVMSSPVSGSMPTISVNPLTRRVIFVPTLTCPCSSTRLSAVSKARGRSMGSFSSLWTMACTSSAWKVE